MRSPFRVLAAVAAASVLSGGCKKAPEDANPQFNDAVLFTFVAFGGSEADLAFGMRALEAQIYLGMDVEAEDAKDRALTPQRLSEADVADIDHPDVPPEDALPVAVAATSDYAIEDHAVIPLFADQTPFEPYSPDTYDRTFLEGSELCWPDKGCPFLYTVNDIVKKNFLMTVPYVLYKDFRWVDLNLPDPADVPDGEEPVNDGEKRWAIAARAWQPESADGEGGDTHILQSYTIEVWIPRDGQGFVRDGTEQNANDGEWTSDSEGGGTLRLLCLWSQTTFDAIEFSEDQVAGTTREGIDDNMRAHEDWLDEQHADR